MRRIKLIFVKDIKQCLHVANAVLNLTMTMYTCVYVYTRTHPAVLVEYPAYS